MRKKQSPLLRELNPRYDMSRFNEEVGTLKDYALFALGVCKSSVRGTIAGAGVGGLVGLATGLIGGGDIKAETADAMITGWILGHSLDTIQFSTRYAAHMIKDSLINPTKKYLASKKVGAQ